MESQRQSRHRPNMKLLLPILLLVAPALCADDAPRFAYLVVPAPDTSTPAPTTVRPQQDEKQTVENYNEEVMEGLRQGAGPVYHIYLPDGRLQRVEYTAVGEQTEGPRYGRQEAAPGLRGFYYVQVPGERSQALRSPQTTSAPGEQESGDENSTKNLTSTNNQTNTNNQTYSNNQTSQAPVSGRYTENAAANVNAEFVPVRFVTLDQLSQIRSSAAESSGRSPEEVSSRQAESPAQYLANVKYSEVQPIQGPVFSYSSDQLVRILRQA